MLTCLIKYISGEDAFNDYIITFVKINDCLSQGRFLRNDPTLF